ncbi:MAG: DUF1028 domain-containing protein [Flavobacteriales bacterium]|nr:DUF1028 domain-containing protein [Flavobacteriales bacterium]
MSIQWKMFAQDTFSIVAVDSVTGEVGSAGASCVDLFNTSLSNDDFLGVLLPGKGAINTQAYYLPANQDNATARMNAGDSPEQIIEWLRQNDVEGRPERRQYGIAALDGGSARAAAFTGSSTDDHKGHLVGTHYAIQGNILLGQQVLDSMESRFLAAKGDLACRLMAALQGANVVGADSRCASNGTSSLFAFVKVAQREDEADNPSFVLSVRTRDNSRIEPIDSLQTLFDAAKGCWGLGYPLPVHSERMRIFPNPTNGILHISSPASGTKYRLLNWQGTPLLSGTLENDHSIELTALPGGIYLLLMQNEEGVYAEKVILE